MWTIIKIDKKKFYSLKQDLKINLGVRQKFIDLNFLLKNLETINCIKGNSIFLATIYFVIIMVL